MEYGAKIMHPNKHDSVLPYCCANLPAPTKVTSEAFQNHSNINPQFYTITHPSHHAFAGKYSATLKLLAVFVSIIFLLSSICNAQTRKQTAAGTAGIRQKQDELSQIKDQITSLENELRLKSIKERQSYNVLDNYNRQSFLLHSLIDKLKAEEQIKEQGILKTQNNIYELKKEVKGLKENYAKYIIAIYKHGKIDEWASVLDAASFEQALLRYKYLKKFSEQRERDLSKLRSKEEDLITAKNSLIKERDEKSALAEEKSGEENNLEVKRVERKRILSAIKNDKAALRSEIDAKRNAEIKIQNIITKLIAEEEARRKAEAEAKRLARLKSHSISKAYTEKSNTEESAPLEEKPYDVNLSTAGFSSFAALKGRMNWPVSRGRVVRNFGENRNEKLNTVTLNYGIDIKTAADADVHAVADGVVSVIDWLPGYGSVLILTHKGDYRTVYSHLSDIFVKEGDRVKAGAVLGKVGESLEGNILHFEIWNQRNKQNPESWLARK